MSNHDDWLPAFRAEINRKVNAVVGSNSEGFGRELTAPEDPRTSRSSVVHQPFTAYIVPEKYLRNAGYAGHIEEGGAFWHLRKFRDEDRTQPLFGPFIYLRLRELPVEWKKMYAGTTFSEIDFAILAYKNHDGVTKLATVNRSAIVADRWRKEVSDGLVCELLDELGPGFRDQYSRGNGHAVGGGKAADGDPSARDRLHQLAQAPGALAPKRRGGVHDGWNAPGVAEGADHVVEEGVSLPISAMSDFRRHESGKALIVSLSYICASWRLKLASQCIGCSDTSPWSVEMETTFPHSHRMISLDTETTGLETPPVDAIVEIGLVVFDKGVIVNEYSSVICPDERFFGSKWKECERIHGIRMSEAKAAPGMDQVAEEVVDFIAPYVAAGFDVQAFNRAFDKRMCEAVGMRLSTRMMAKHKRPVIWGEDIMTAMETETKARKMTSSRSAAYYGGGGVRNFRISLEDSCAMMGVKREGQKHRAAHDAFDAGRLYFSILQARAERCAKFLVNEE